jgi:hypothetical protein
VMSHTLLHVSYADRGFNYKAVAYYSYHIHLWVIQQEE